MPPHNRIADFVETYTRDLKAEDLQRLFTRDARDAYRFFTRQIDLSAFDGLPWYKRLLARLRVLFLAFTMKLSPARRMVYGASLLFMAFGLVNLLRAVRLAEAPIGRVTAPGVETAGLSRPANTVGGDFYDVLPLGEGRVAVAVGDVAGKGSPAALLMALLLAMMRTLVDERLEPAELVARLNVQVSRHAPGSRFITLFYGVYDMRSGELTYVNAGHTPPLLVRGDDCIERLNEGGVAP